MPLPFDVPPLPLLLGGVGQSWGQLALFSPNADSQTELPHSNVCDDGGAVVVVGTGTVVGGGAMLVVPVVADP